MQATPSAPALPAVLTTPLTSLGAGVRWATLTLGLVLAAVAGEVTARTGASALALAAVAIWQSDNRTRGEAPGWRVGLVELVVDVAAIVATGAWTSPFAVCLLGGVMAFGFAQGFAAALKAAGAVIVTVAVPFHLRIDDIGFDSLRLTGQWAVVLVLVAVLAGYAR